MSEATGSSLVKDSEKAGKIAEMLKALAHPLRLQILAVLCGGEAHVNALAERLGVNQPLISQQLRILRMNQLVRVEREGGLAVYSLLEPRVIQVIQCMERCERFFTGESNE